MSLPLRGPLCSQEQFRFLENAVAHDTGSFAPRHIKLCRLPGIAMMRHPNGGHAFAIPGAEARHRTRYFIASPAAIFPSRTCC